MPKFIRATFNGARAPSNRSISAEKQGFGSCWNGSISIRT